MMHPDYYRHQDNARHHTKERFLERFGKELTNDTYEVLNNQVRDGVAILHDDEIDGNRAKYIVHTPHDGPALVVFDHALERIVTIYDRHWDQVQDAMLEHGLVQNQDWFDQLAVRIAANESVGTQKLSSSQTVHVLKEPDGEYAVVVYQKSRKAVVREVYGEKRERHIRKFEERMAEEELHRAVLAGEVERPDDWGPAKYQARRRVFRAQRSPEGLVEIVGDCEMINEGQHNLFFEIERFEQLAPDLWTGTLYVCEDDPDYGIISFPNQALAVKYQQEIVLNVGEDFFTTYVSNREAQRYIGRQVLKSLETLNQWLKSANLNHMVVKHNFRPNSTIELILGSKL